MKLLAASYLLAFAILPLSLPAQDDAPLGDVARQSKAESENIRKMHPNLRAPIEAEGTKSDDNSSAGLAYNDPGPDPTGAKEIVDHGLELDHEGRFDEALAEYSKALKLRPDYARAYYDIGVVKDEQHNTSEAIDAYKKAMSLNDKDFRCYANLGKVLIDAKQPAEAEEVLRKGDRLFPDTLVIMMNLGNALIDQHQYEESMPYFRKILAEEPGYDPARQSLIYSLVQLGRRDEAANVKAEWPSYRPTRN